MLKRQYRNDPTAMRELLILADDTDALAAMDNQIIHGSQTVVTDR